MPSVEQLPLKFGFVNYYDAKLTRGETVSVYEHLGKVVFFMTNGHQILP